MIVIPEIDSNWIPVSSGRFREWFRVILYRIVIEPCWKLPRFSDAEITVALIQGV